MTGRSPGFELPEELVIDTDAARRAVGDFIREQLRRTGFERVVLGLSGGIDSALVAFLAAEAIGSEQLLCLLMPYRTSSDASRTDAEEVVRRLGCAAELVDVSGMLDAYFSTPERADASALRRGNLASRMRMSVLYDHSVTWPGLVAGTGNKTEILVGYTTLYGDSACAFAPLGDLYKSQVRQLAVAMGVPEAIVVKDPSADLWPGQTDEQELGLSYAKLDRLLYWMIDRQRGPDQLTAMGFEPDEVERVQQQVATSEFKRQMPPVARLVRQDIDDDSLQPGGRAAPTRQ